jgi:hypothetical protein
LSGGWRAAETSAPWDLDPADEVADEAQDFTLGQIGFRELRAEGFLGRRPARLALSHHRLPPVHHGLL